MMIKFLRHGQGSTARAVDYLLQSKDHKGERRPTVAVLRGNPQQVAELGDSLTFKHRYRSAVIAWADTDRPTQAQKEEVLKEFERLAFAGLEADQYHYLAVDHGDHIHIIAPRVELRTGKSLNIAPPGWEKTYDPLRDFFNEKYGWKSPNIEAHPENARTLAGLEAHDLPKSVKKAKEMIHAHALDAVERGLIKNRDDMRKWLSSLGEITRDGKDYISVKPSGFTKPIRLKGAIYERDFDAGRVGEEIEEAKRRGAEADRADRERRAEELHRKLEALYHHRAEYNLSRYRRSTAQDRARYERDERSNRAELEQDAKRSNQAEQSVTRRADQRDRRASRRAEDTAKETMDISADRADDYGRIRRLGDVGTKRVSIERDRGADQAIGAAQSGSEEAKSDDEPLRSAELEQRNRREEKATYMARQTNGSMDRAAGQRRIDDRVRAEIERSAEDTAASLRAEDQRDRKRLSQQFEANQRSIHEANQRSTAHYRLARQAIERIRRVVEQVKRVGAKFARKLYKTIGRTINRRLYMRKNIEHRAAAIRRWNEILEKESRKRTPLYPIAAPVFNCAYMFGSILYDRSFDYYMLHRDANGDAIGVEDRHGNIVAGRAGLFFVTSPPRPRRIVLVKDTIDAMCVGEYVDLNFDLLIGVHKPYDQFIKDELQRIFDKYDDASVSIYANNEYNAEEIAQIVPKKIRKEAKENIFLPTQGDSFVEKAQRMRQSERRPNNYRRQNSFKLKM